MRDLTAIAPAANACLGELWRGGEPLYDELLRAKVWGELLNWTHGAATFAAGDLNWLGGFSPVTCQHLRGWWFCIEGGLSCPC